MVWKHVVIYFCTDALLKEVDEAKQRSISASRDAKFAFHSIILSHTVYETLWTCFR